MVCFVDGDRPDVSRVEPRLEFDVGGSARMVANTDGARLAEEMQTREKFRQC
jgi:hypothetical protein